MKGIIALTTICLLIFNSLCLSAQDTKPTGQQTVSYITEKIRDTEKLVFIAPDMFDLEKLNNSIMYVVYLGFTNCGSDYDTSPGKDCELTLRYLRFSNLRLYEMRANTGSQMTNGAGSCDDYTFEIFQSFKLKDVVDVTRGKNMKPGSQVEFLNVKLSAPVGIRELDQYYYSDNNPNGKCYTWMKCDLPQCSRKTDDTIGLPYLSTDPANYERLKKAILHLAELTKSVAGKDLFDN